MEKNRWPNIVNLNEVELNEGNKGQNYKWRSSESLADQMGAKKLGYHLEALEPGKFSCPYHFHHSEEELFLVLEGKAMLRQNNQFREVTKGDLIFFTNGPEGAHQFYNHTKEPFLFFALSTMDEFEVAEYPDSGKVFVRRLRKVFQNGSEVDYLKGEEDPAQHWPKEYL